MGIWRSEQNYLNCFAGAGAAKILCDASTAYTKAPMISGVPQRILDFNPEARFIYLMRDPVQRSISHYWHMVAYHAELRAMLSAIQEEPRYTDVSHYAMQLQRYFDVVDPRCVFIMTYERLVEEPCWNSTSCASGLEWTRSRHSRKGPALQT